MNAPIAAEGRVPDEAGPPTFEGWSAHEQSCQELLTASAIDRFNATFDRHPTAAEQIIAPALMHFTLANPITASAGLGTDGHPSRGDFLPPIDLPRRMWASGKVTFHAPIHAGETVSRLSRVVGVKHKRGSTGLLCFVDVHHELKSAGRLAVEERQVIVYRGEMSGTASGSSKPVERGPEGEHRRSFQASQPTLFRYSALTFNSHRIHYDEPYARDVEGYDGLVVHGPLQATLLAQFATDLRGTVPKTFEFRSTQPLFAPCEVELHASDADDAGVELWTKTHDGPAAMKARASW